MTHGTSRSRAAAFATSIKPLFAAGAITLALVPLAALTATSPAFAQSDTDAPKKPAKKKKPKPAAADAPPAEPAPAPEPTPAPAPAEAPAPAPAADAATAAATTSTPPTDDNPITDTFEKPAQTYYFIGLRYRMTIIPKFLMNIFVDEGTTFISHSVGLELDVRRDNFSLIPAITYTSLGFGDALFHQKGKPIDDQDYSDVSSQLNAIFVSADILWSKDIAKHWSFEYGAGFGIGAIFGGLTNDWVYSNSANSGPLVSGAGTHYNACQTPNDAPSCQTALHSGATVAKVGNYQEPNWFNGGSIPVIFPQISVPQLGLRYKPIKELEARLLIGFSLTGPFFQLSADYGFPSGQRESTTKPDEKPASAR